VLEAAAAGIDLTGEGLSLVDEMLRLSDSRVSLADFQEAGFTSDGVPQNSSDLAAVIQGMDAVLVAAAGADVQPGGIPALVIDDELANALAEAGITTAGVPGVEVQVEATADLQGTDGGLAVLASSLKDWVQAGVDAVNLTADTDVLMLMRDTGDTGALGFGLADIPSFDSTANPQGSVGLVVDEDDLAALINSLGGDTTEDDAIAALEAKGFDVHVESTHIADTASDFHITEQDLVQLLGQSSDATDPFDPFHKP
jgi:hypothetical protein